MATERRNEIIQVLDCDVDVRPEAAPGIGALLPHARGVSRTPTALVVEFDPQVTDILEVFVEAERLCCAGIGWKIERDAGLRLRITANDAQLTTIESLWKASIESYR
jgi:hypothetical protein